MTFPDSTDEREKIRTAMSDPLAVCTWLGIAEGHKRQARGIVIRCPKHAENNPSCSVTRADGGGLGVRCFAGCDFGGGKGGGDEISLVAAAKDIDIRHDFRAALQIAAGFAGVTLSDGPRAERPRIVRAVPVPAADVSAHWSALPAIDADAWEYLASRGLADAAEWCRSVPDRGIAAPGSLLGREEETVQWGIGMRIAVAMRDGSGRIVAIQARNIGLPHDFRVLGSSQSGLFGQVDAVKDAETVLIAEGLTDTLAALVGMKGAKSMAVVGIAGTNNREAIATLPLEGKRVLVAMDADTSTKGEIKGDEAAKIIADELTKSGAKPVRLRPEGGKDLADMLASGMDLLAFARGAWSKAGGFKPYGGRVRVERAARLAEMPHHVEIGIPFLSAVFRSLIRCDVLLLGAETGIGKTQAATIMAMKAAESGRRVHYFALEAEEGEIERRIKYKLLAALIYGAKIPDRERLNYVDWRLGLLDDLTGPYEGGADALLSDKYKSLFTFYRTACQSFSAVDLKRISSMLKDESDLVIIDHFHYIDSDEDNENRAARRLIRSISDVNAMTGIPAVLVAHLKKLQEQKTPPLVPRLADFHGASDLSKIVTKAVIFAPAHDQPQKEQWLFPTYVRVAKFRLAGERTRFCGLMDFNVRNTDYDEGFDVGKLIDGDRKFAFIEGDKLPPWARP